MPRFHTICYSKQSEDCQHRIKRHFKFLQCRNLNIQCSTSSVGNRASCLIIHSWCYFMLAQKIAFQQTIVASSSFKKSSDNLPAWFEPWSSSTCQLLSFSDSVNLIFLTRICSRMSKSGLPPTRAPTLSTLDQLDKWKEEGETRTRWGTSLQFSSNLATPILLEGTEKPFHKTKSHS